MLDVSGQNADEFFEDIGHSGEARKEMENYLIGTYKMTEAEIAKMKSDAEKKKIEQNSCVNHTVRCEKKQKSSKVPLNN